MKRSVIEIDDELCDGCGQCATGCHESAIQIIEGKARLVGDSLCDGLGACVGDCPRGAITVVEREAQAYDEAAVIRRILPQGTATLAAHFRHLRDHGQDSWLAQGMEAAASAGVVVPGFDTPAAALGGSGRTPEVQARSRPATAPLTHAGCPGILSRSFTPAGPAPVPPVRARAPGGQAGGMASRLDHWPVQLHLINPRAPYFRGADILVAADCTAYACGAFHQALLAGRKLVIACPKLDSGRDVYVDKIRALVDKSGAASITVAVMDVPCCGGIGRLVDEALAGASAAVPVSTVVVSSRGGSLTWL